MDACGSGEETFEVSTDSDACIDDLGVIVPYLLEFERDLSEKNWNQLKFDVTAALPILTNTMKDCFDKSNPIRGRSLQSAQCMNDLLSLLPDLEELLGDIRAGNINRIAGDLERTIPALNITYYQCFGNASPVSFESLESGSCLEDLLSIVPLVRTVVSQLEAGQVEEAIASALALVGPLETAYADCFEAELKTIPQTQESLQQLGYGDTCIDTLFYSIAYYQEVVGAYKGNDPGEIVIQTQEAQDQLASVAKYC
jgi:hypothetical protein